MSGLANPALGSLGRSAATRSPSRRPPNFNGPTSFTYRVRDGNGGTVGANGVLEHRHGHDHRERGERHPDGRPEVGDHDPRTPPVTVQADRHRRRGRRQPDLHRERRGGQATNGGAACPTTGVCTYTPTLNFFGSDSFVVRGTDSQGGLRRRRRSA